MSATISEIARRAGVTDGTVSRVLNSLHEPKYRSAVRRAEKIRRIAAQMGYRPHAAARVTRQGRFQAVGLLASLDRRRRYMPVELLEAVHDALAEHDLQLTYAKVPDAKLTDAGFVPRLLREWSVDGLLINYSHGFPAAMVELIDRFRIPSVWMNTRRATDAVYPDDRAAAEEATRYLLASGRARIAYLALQRPGSEEHYSTAERAEGYRGAMAAAGRPALVTQIPVREWANGSGLIADDRLDVLRRWLSGPDRPDAVVTYSGWTAEPLVFAATAAGLRLPDDLRIVSLGGVAMSSPLGLPLTQVVSDVAQLGRAAVAMLNRKLASPAFPLPAEPIAGRLALGST